MNRYVTITQAEDLNNIITTSLPEFAIESVQILITTTSERVHLISPITGAIFYILHSYHILKSNHEDFEDVMDAIIYISDRLMRYSDDIEFIATVLQLTTTFTIQESITTSSIAAAATSTSAATMTRPNTSAGLTTASSNSVSDEQSIQLLRSLQSLCKVIFETNHLMISVERRLESRGGGGIGQLGGGKGNNLGGGHSSFVGNLKAIVFNGKDKEKISKAVETLKDRFSVLERAVVATYGHAQQINSTMTATPGLMGTELGLMPLSMSVPGTAGIRPKASNNHESELFQLKFILSPISFDEILHYHNQFYAKDSRSWLIDEVKEWFASAARKTTNTGTSGGGIGHKKKASPAHRSQQAQLAISSSLMTNNVNSGTSSATTSASTSASASASQTPRKQSQQVQPPQQVPAHKKNVFWLQAAPGMGKSVFSSALAKTIHRDRLLGVIFFQFNDPRCWDPIQILKSLIFQLVAKFPEICAKMLEIMEAYKHQVETVTVVYERYFIAALALLQSAEIISEEEPMLIILDGIDEVAPTFGSHSSSTSGDMASSSGEDGAAGDSPTTDATGGENPRKRFLNMLANKLIRQQSECVKLFVTSRNTPELEKILLPYSHVITENDPRHGQDVRRFIHQSLQEVYEESFPEVISSGQGWESVTDLLYTKSEGKFIYTSLIGDELNRIAENCNTPTTPDYNLTYFQQSLEALPNGLDDCFMTIFNQLGNMINDAEMFRHFVILLVTAYEPIAVEVMKFMLNLPTTSKERREASGDGYGYGSNSTDFMGSVRGSKYGSSQKGGRSRVPSQASSYHVNAQMNLPGSLQSSFSRSSDGGGAAVIPNGGNVSKAKGSKRSSRRTSFDYPGAPVNHNHHHKRVAGYGTGNSSVNHDKRHMSRSRSADFADSNSAFGGSKFGGSKVSRRRDMDDGLEPEYTEDEIMRSSYSAVLDDASAIADRGDDDDEEEDLIDKEFEIFLGKLIRLFPIHCLESSITGDVERKLYPCHKSLVDWLLDESRSHQWYVHLTQGHEMIIRQSLKYFQITTTAPGGLGSQSRENPSSGGSVNGTYPLTSLGGGAGDIVTGEHLRNIDSLKSIQMSYYYDFYNNYDDIDNERKNDLVALYYFHHLTKHLDAYHQLSHQNWTLLTYFLFTSLSWLQWSLEALSVDVVIENINRTLWFISSLTTVNNAGSAPSSKLRLDRLASDYTLIVWLLDFLSPASRHPWFQGWLNELPTQIIARLKDYLFSGRLTALYADAQQYLNIYGGWEIISAPLTTPNSILQRAVKIENAILQAINFDSTYCAAIVCSLRSEDPYRYIAIINTNTGEMVKKLEGHAMGVTALHYLGDKELISGSADDTLRVWDIDSGDCTAVMFNAGAKVQIIHSNCQFKQDGWGFEAANFRMVTYAKNDTKIKIWTNECNRVNPATVEIPSQFQPHGGAVAHLPSHLRSNGRENSGSPRVTFAAGTLGGHGRNNAAAAALATALGPQCFVLEVPNLVRAMSFITIQHFVYGTKNADMFLVDAFNNKVVKTIASLGKAMTGICILDRDSFVVSHEGGDMSIWDTDPKRFHKIRSIKCNNYNMRNLTYLGNQRIAFTFLQDLESSDDDNESPEVGKVFIWNIEQGKRETTLGGSFLPQVLSSCSSSSSTRMFHEEKLISYGMDGWIKTYNIEAVPNANGGTGSGNNPINTSSASDRYQPRRTLSNSSMQTMTKNALFNNTLISIDRERIVTTTSDGALVVCNIQTGEKQFMVDVVTGSKCCLVPFKNTSTYLQPPSNPEGGYDSNGLSNALSTIGGEDVEDRMYVVCVDEEVMLFNVRTKEVEQRFEGCYGNVEVMDDHHFLAIESMPKDIVNNAKKPIMKQSKWLLSQQNKPSFSLCHIDTAECIRQCGFPYETIHCTLYLPPLQIDSSKETVIEKTEEVATEPTGEDIDEETAAEVAAKAIRKSGSRGKLLTGMNCIIKLWNLEEPEETEVSTDLKKSENEESVGTEEEVSLEKAIKESDDKKKSKTANHNTKSKEKSNATPPKQEKEKKHVRIMDENGETDDTQKEKEGKKQGTVFKDHASKSDQEKEKLRREARCERIFAGHTDQVTQLIRVKDDIFASVSKDLTIRIWCLLTGECLGVLDIEDFNEHAKLCFVKLEEDLPAHEEDEDYFYYNNDRSVMDGDEGEAMMEREYPKKMSRQRSATGTRKSIEEGVSIGGEKDTRFQQNPNPQSTPQPSKSAESMDGSTTVATNSVGGITLSSSMSMSFSMSRTMSTDPLLPPSKTSQAAAAALRTMTIEEASPLTTNEDNSLDVSAEQDGKDVHEPVAEEEGVEAEPEEPVVEEISPALAAQREQRNLEEKRRKRRGPGRLYYRYDQEMLRIWDFKTLLPIADLKLPGILVAMETDGPRLDGKFFFHEDHSPSNLIFNKENFYVFSSWKSLVFAKKIEPNYDLWY